MRKLRQPKLAGSQSGQALIEYILILVVSVLLVGGLVYQFNDAFRVWAKSYLGDYTSCLLETGELPMLGSSDGAGACADVMKNFDLADGKDSKGGDSRSGSGGGSGSDQNGEGKDKNKDGQAAGESAATTSGSKRSGGNGIGDSGSGSSMSKAGQEGRSPEVRKKNIYTGSTDDSLVSAGIGGRTSGRGSRRPSAYSGSYYTTQSQETPEQTARAPMKVGESVDKPKVNKFKVKVKKKEELGEEPDLNMGVGDYFRFFIIAAIIIILILVIMGQVLQFSKSSE